MVPRIMASLLALAFLFSGCISGEVTEPDDEEGTEEITATFIEDVLWGSVSDASIRPGAPIGWCTYNFLWVDPDGEEGHENTTLENGTRLPTYYIGTAAHCVDDVGQRMPLVGLGEIGTVAFTSYNETFIEDHGIREGMDFALIRLDPGLNQDAHPQMMNTQGPTGYTTSQDVEVGDELEHHGYGMVFGDVEPLRDRPGWIVDYGQDYCSESVIWWGDSGSPVLHADTGKALGIVSRAGWVECVPASQLAGATVEHILEELAKTPFSDVRLALADGSYTTPGGSNETA